MCDSKNVLTFVQTFEYVGDGMVPAKQEMKSINGQVNDQFRDVVKIFKALADTSRLRIISYLIQNEDTHVSEIAQELGMSISRVSHHLSILEKLGFAMNRQNGKQVFYSIDDNCIIDIIARANEHVRGK